MRHFLPLLAALLPLAAQAADLTATARVTEATVYGEGARVTWAVTVSGPEGEGRVTVRLPAIDPAGHNLEIGITPDADILSYRLSYSFPGRSLSDTPLTQAEADLRALEAKERDLKSKVDDAEARISSADAKIAYLGRLGSDQTAIAPAPLDSIRAVSDLVAAEVRKAEAERILALSDKRVVEAELATLTNALERMRSAYQEMSPDEEFTTDLILDMTKRGAADVVIPVRQFAQQAGWSPAYDLTIDRVAGKVGMARSLSVWQASGADWTGVALTLSTAPTDGQTDSAKLYPDLRAIISPEERGMAAPVMEEAPVVEKAASGFPILYYTGDTVTYRYDRLVDLPHGAAVLTLPLDRIDLPAEATAVAVPSRDRTAFMQVKVTNPTKEMLLPGPATLYRDGALVGMTQFAALAPGVDTKIGFGPIEALRLKRSDPLRNTGSRGVLTSSTEREEKAEIEVRNVGAEAWTVRLIDQVPYSEQEDLTATWEADPLPSETDVDSQRGILAWTLDVPPGEARTVTLTSRLSWPEGMELR
jgi:uncharacterized protein (TIGR02231 family)